MIAIHTEPEIGLAWLHKYRGQQPHFSCVLGFTATALIPGISAAGLTPADRQKTALADGEFLAKGICPNYKYPLPPLVAGASPAMITKAIVAALKIPVTILNSGLPEQPSFICEDLGGQTAACLSTGHALPLEMVRHLWQQGWDWGERLIGTAAYLIIGECVVGGTTTAQAVLTALGYGAAGKVNSSHPQCNHNQKRQLVARGLAVLGEQRDPRLIVAALGDPMQIVVAAMMLAASRRGGVLLAGGTQMLAVYALGRAIAIQENITYRPEEIAIGTTSWVAQDPSGDTIGLAKSIPQACLLSAELSFGGSILPQLQVYDRGFVKEGVGAGASAITAHLYRDWGNLEVLKATEKLLQGYLDLPSSSKSRSMDKVEIDPHPP
jgi:uncharacterized protein (TIGR00303 family)